MQKTWRLILDVKRSGFENMAVDEAILLEYSRNKIPTLRIYGWSEPIVSLGYRQNPSAVLCSPDDFSFVRRITGGAAMLHDQELTYSIACARSDLDLPQSVKQSYYILCSFLKHFYSNLGFGSNFVYETSSSNVSYYGNHCFSGRQESDLLINGKKIGGNAQRRKKDIIFQHGSIPQKIDFIRLVEVVNDCRDTFDKTISLDTLLGRDTEFIKLQNILADSFSNTFKVRCLKQLLSNGEENISKCLLSNKYKQDRWNRENEKAVVVE